MMDGIKQVFLQCGNFLINTNGANFSLEFDCANGANLFLIKPSFYQSHVSALKRALALNWNHPLGVKQSRYLIEMYETFIWVSYARSPSICRSLSNKLHSL